MSNAQGYAGYYDAANEAAEEGMSGYDFLGAIQETDRPLLYIPDLAPVGSGLAYYPRSVDDDAVALNVLGFQAGFPGGGNGQAADKSRAEGAWDSTFRGAVTAFQQRHPASGAADGWIGPNTRRALAAAVVAFNLKAPSIHPLPQPVIPPALPAPGGNASPAPGLVIPAPPAPGVSPTPPKVQPPAPVAGLLTTRNLIIGGGVAAAAAAAYFLLK